MIINQFGTMTISSDKANVAGEFNEIKFILRPVADFKMQPRTTVEIVQFTRFYSNQFSLPQTQDPTAPGFILAKRSDGKFIDVTIKRIPAVYFRHGSTYHVIQLTIGESPLETGGFIEIIYGYKGAGSVGTKCPPLAKMYSFPVFISQRHVLGGERFMEDSSVSFDSLFVNNSNVSTNYVKEQAAFNPQLAVEGGSPEKLKIIVSPRGDNKALVTCNVTDAFGNLSPNINGFAELNQIDSVKLNKGYGKAYIDIKEEGVQRISGQYNDLNLYALSNPFSIDQKLAWGEIHCHSGISDGLGTDEENYQSAIHSGLDFGALSDHDTLMEKDAALWKKTVQNAIEYADEPDFITLLGYESLAYHNGNIAGHINIYYPGIDGEMVGRPELKDIPHICKEFGAVAIPHHTMYGGPFFGQMGMKMDYLKAEDFPVEIMPVTEIYSTHGSSEADGCERSVLGTDRERSVNSALQRGFRWGFTGGSDNHESLLGSHFRVDKVPRTINNEHMQFRHGLTAAYVDEFSRNSILSAMKNRSVYATTGERILLKFNINDIPMGNEIHYTKSRDIFVEVHGTALISRIDIIRNGHIIHQRNPEKLDCSLFFIDEEELKDSAYYYIKVIQTDKEMAWSSPVWVSVG